MWISEQNTCIRGFIVTEGQRTQQKVEERSEENSKQTELVKLNAIFINNNICEMKQYHPPKIENCFIIVIRKLYLLSSWNPRVMQYVVK